LSTSATERRSPPSPPTSKKTTESYRSPDSGFKGSGSTEDVEPERNTSASSMQVPPITSVCTGVVARLPGNGAMEMVSSQSSSRPSLRSRDPPG
jgi:hypothetical protein